MKKERLMARDYFVENGFTMKTIETLMDGQVTKKTLYNWRNNEDGTDANGTWDEQRKAKIQKYDNLKDDILDLAVLAVREAKTNPDSRSIFAVAKILGALKIYKTLNMEDEMKVPDSGDDKDKKVDPNKIVEEVEKLLMG